MQILLVGANGRMGRKMQEVLSEKKIEFLGIDKTDREKAEKYDYDIVIDFSSSESLYENLLLADKRRVPIIIATTNHNEQNMKLIQKFKKRVAIFMASNFSVLFNVLLKMLPALNNLMGNDIVVEEIHHKNKKDSPSGSCKEILRILKDADHDPTVVSLRVGDVVGEHCVTVYGANEMLKISHTATDRKVFCEGVLKACEFLADKHSGLFEMKDMV